MKQLTNSFRLLGALCLAAILYSCASIGNPSGGPRDEDPPRFVRANPPQGATNVTKTNATIIFDELINVKDAFSKVVVSPTSSKQPRVSSNGRRITVQFQDTLQPNTTYVVDFGNSIEDNNEGNKLPAFTYRFSTGDAIDSLQISGMVLAARNLEPQQAMLVGVYSSVDDTTFQRKRLERVAKTDDRGRFTIRGLKEGTYHLFALGDLNNDLRWDNPEEDIAFLPITITPTSEPSSTTDTIYNLKTGEVDSVVVRQRTRFLPNDILLSSFNTGYKAQYLTNNSRIDSTRISLIFNTRSDSLPELSVVGRPDLKDWYTLERSLHNDTLTYWIRDKEIIHLDSLMVAARYLRTDTAKQLSWTNDTLRLFMKKAKPAKPAKQKKEKKKRRGDSSEDLDSLPKGPSPMRLNLVYGAQLDINRKPILEFEYPLDTLIYKKIRLEEQQDSLWLPVRQAFRFEPVDSISIRRYQVDYPWNFDTSYRLQIDSLAAIGIYGNPLANNTFEFKTKKEDEYSTLIMNITGMNDTIPAFVELLNKSDSPVAIGIVENGRATLPYIMPGTYYARIVEDLNGNGEWDAGSYEDSIQPELVYYYPKKITLKANWDLEQSWNVFELPINAQKPAAILKNKPEADKKRRNKNDQTEEDEEDEYFDPNRNPFDPNDKQRRNVNPNLRR